MTKIFAVIGIAFVAAIVYIMTVYLSAILSVALEEEEIIFVIGVSGCILFVCVVMFWATTECPFFVG